MSRPDLHTAPVSTATRAELVYRAARFDLDNRLWAAALGRTEPDENEAKPASPSLLNLDTLIEALQADDRIQPHLSPEPPQPPSPGGPLRLGANQHLQPALEAAADRTGLDPTVLASIVDAEAARGRDGSWDPASRNPRSSAAGLGQFLSGTWLGEAQRPGSWLHATAGERGWLGSDGKVRADARPALLALRMDPAASIEAIADHAAANLRHLRARGVATPDLPSTARAAYLAHHLGLGDAVRYLGAGLSEDRAGRLLAAQVGAPAAARRIAAADSAVGAHRAWLDHYVAARIRPDRFTAA